MGLADRVALPGGRRCAAQRAARAAGRGASRRSTREPRRPRFLEAAAPPARGSATGG